MKELIGPIEFRFRVEKSDNSIKVQLINAEDVKKGIDSFAGLRGVYIWVYYESKNGEFNWKRLKSCACESDIHKEFGNDRERCNQKFENVADNPIILIGETGDFKRRIIEFLGSLVDNYDIFSENFDVELSLRKYGRTDKPRLYELVETEQIKLSELKKYITITAIGPEHRKEIHIIGPEHRKEIHIEGARIRKLLEKCTSNLKLPLNLNLYLYFIKYLRNKELEDSLLYAFQLKYNNFLPLFNKKGPELYQRIENAKRILDYLINSNPNIPA